MTEHFIKDLLADLLDCSNNNCNEHCMYYMGMGYPECCRQLCKTAHDTIEELAKTAKKQRIKMRREKEKANVDKSNEDVCEPADIN